MPLTDSELRSELERHHRDALAWAVRCCGGRKTDGEDALQTAYLKILDGRARFDGAATFKTWLFGIIRYTALEQGRRHRWLILADDGYAEPLENVAAPATAATMETAALSAALKRLSPRQQQLLHLVFYQELTIDDAARVLGLSLGSARTHYERGKEKLRSLLKRGQPA